MQEKDLLKKKRIQIEDRIKSLETKTIAKSLKNSVGSVVSEKEIQQVSKSIQKLPQADRDLITKFTSRVKNILNNQDIFKTKILSDSVEELSEEDQVDKLAKELAVEKGIALPIARAEVRENMKLKSKGAK